MATDISPIPPLSDKNSCIHAGSVYPEAAMICGHEICIVCKQGEWEEKSID